MLTHGGDIAGYFAEYGHAPLDFSANVSPLGLPDGIRDAVVDSLACADQYPDPLCRDLRAAIAACRRIAGEKGAGLGLKIKTHRMKSYLLLLGFLAGISGVA